MYKKTIRITILSAAASVLLTACAAQGPEFGDAVRHMKEQQIQNLDAAYNPDPTPVVGGDVYKLIDILDAHRNNAIDSTEDYGATRIGGQ